MKFTPEHYEALKESIKPIINKVDKEGKTETRYLWDIYWASDWWVKHTKHSYLDTHIQTAIKQAVKEINK